MPASVQRSRHLAVNKIVKYVRHPCFQSHISRVRINSTNDKYSEQNVTECKRGREDQPITFGLMVMEGRPFSKPLS